MTRAAGRGAQWALLAAQAALLALAAWAFAMGPARLPFLDAASRGVAPDGDWRAGGPRERFNLPAYELALALAHLEAASDAPRDAVEVQTHAIAAAESAAASLRMRPLDPFAWTALARAERMRGREQAALEALERSYAVSPYNQALSFSRVLTGYDLWSRLSPDARRAMLRDVRVMGWSKDPAVRVFLDATPEARQLSALARAAGL